MRTWNVYTKGDRTRKARVMWLGVRIIGNVFRKNNPILFRHWITSRNLIRIIDIVRLYNINYHCKNNVRQKFNYSMSGTRVTLNPSLYPVQNSRAFIILVFRWRVHTRFLLVFFSSVPMGNTAWRSILWKSLFSHGLVWVNLLCFGNIFDWKNELRFAYLFQKSHAFAF